ELWAVKDWQFTVTSILEQRGVLTRADIDAFQPSRPDAEALAKQRELFVGRLIRHISGQPEQLKYS
ncbi:MAG: hypothetical protein NZ518_07860, partial [Dehalococcoidia bacterium]|nr:hypothetical protein [Dehalococcoidia bacterium]